MLGLSATERCHVRHHSGEPCARDDESPKDRQGELSTVGAVCLKVRISFTRRS